MIVALTAKVSPVLDEPSKAQGDTVETDDNIDDEVQPGG
jgi:hypothetical protein